MTEIPEETESKGATGRRGYVPYGLPFGFPFAAAYRWPYVPRAMPYWGYGPALFGAGSPFGVPYSAERARKAELEALKAQAEYFEDVLKDIKDDIARLDRQGENKE